uniref:Secreted protein n=1 Tax=uncultured Thiotrichaceae bacterium TaxID=298394 RepID=A0A6S6UKY0_9GAMM|nr:MAG: Unknown protein [uncultured Thiotrichaceae bacterium]
MRIAGLPLQSVPTMLWINTVSAVTATVLATTACSTESTSDVLAANAARTAAKSTDNSSPAIAWANAVTLAGSSCAVTVPLISTALVTVTLTG